ncbi:MAG: ParB/RepB/Spo0J family partition protein, partial [Planctomycetota bacterium]
MPPGANPNPEPREGVQSLTLRVDEVEANPFQPRREFNPDEIASLAESIRSHQQLQPILVRIVDGRYQLISGERRLRATIHAGLETIRAEVREADDRLVAELAIIENLQRKDLNPIEKAMSF